MAQVDKPLPAMGDLFGYLLKEVRRLVQEGIESGPGRFDSIEDIKAEARRRKETATLGQ